MKLKKIKSPQELFKKERQQQHKKDRGKPRAIPPKIIKQIEDGKQKTLEDGN
jgi:translation elongation factor EF-Ts